MSSAATTAFTYRSCMRISVEHDRVKTLDGKRRRSVARTTNNESFKVHTLGLHWNFLVKQARRFSFLRDHTVNIQNAENTPHCLSRQQQPDKQNVAIDEPLLRLATSFPWSSLPSGSGCVIERGYYAAFWGNPPQYYSTSHSEVRQEKLHHKIGRKSGRGGGGGVTS